MHAHEGAERAVMAHERVGDRANDPYRTGTEPRIQFIFQINDARRAIGIRFVGHAMIGGDCDRRAKVDKFGDDAIDGLMISVGLRLAGRVFVLHIIRGLEIHQIRPMRRHDFHAGIQYEQR